jgi:AraC-like DNA-binding protein
MAGLRNRFVPLDAIWGLAGSGIRERLGNAATVEHRFALLEAFLLRQWRENNEAAAIVEHVAMKIHRHHGTRIGDLSAAAGVSQKHLITLFNRLVGCTPKALARLTRFHHALDSLDIAAPVRWTDVAYEHDFADQAHFTHDFAAYSGLTPTEYLARRLAVHAERPDHASVPWVLPAG